MKTKSKTNKKKNTFRLCIHQNIFFCRTAFGDRMEGGLRVSYSSFCRWRSCHVDNSVSECRNVADGREATVIARFQQRSQLWRFKSGSFYACGQLLFGSCLGQLRLQFIVEFKGRSLVHLQHLQVKFRGRNASSRFSYVRNRLVIQPTTTTGSALHKLDKLVPNSTSVDDRRRQAKAQGGINQA